MPAVPGAPAKVAPHGAPRQQTRRDGQGQADSHNARR